MGRSRKYQTEEERKAAQRENERRYRETHKDKIAAKNAGYYQRNKDKITEQHAEYQATPFGRANRLLNNYKRNDKDANRGECTLTADWIVQNIFSKPCHYCGRTDWTKLGCDRKDSSLPHTPENCVPCCKHCNDMKGAMSYDDYIKKIKSGGSPTS